MWGKAARMPKDSRASHCGVSIANGGVQWGIAAPLSCINVGALLNKSECNLKAVAGGGGMKGGQPLRVKRRSVGIGAML